MLNVNKSNKTYFLSKYSYDKLSQSNEPTKNVKLIHFV